MDTQCYNKAEDEEIFTFTAKRAAVKINCGDIVFFESYGHCITIHMKDGTTYDFRGTLNEIEKRLKGKGFVRVHRGFIINVSYLDRVCGNWVFLNSKWKSVPLSRLRKQELTKTGADEK